MMQWLKTELEQGSYKAGEAVTLTAAEPEYGYLFDGWKVTEGDLADANLSNESISLTIYPEQHTTYGRKTNKYEQNKVFFEYKYRLVI